ncbi:MAG: hypothetical protein MZW92_75620 [Comamonadaceae bacterium]|nr:hypothetical protein [Comamonadaceae bacterium]
MLSGTAVERINDSVLDELVVTDTIPLREDAQACTQDPPAVGRRRCWPRPCCRISNEDSVSSLFME